MGKYTSASNSPGQSPDTQATEMDRDRCTLHKYSAYTYNANTYCYYDKKNVNVKSYY